MLATCRGRSLVQGTARLNPAVQPLRVKRRIAVPVQMRGGMPLYCHGVHGFIRGIVFVQWHGVEGAAWEDIFVWNAALRRGGLQRAGPYRARAGRDRNARRRLCRAVDAHMEDKEDRRRHCNEDHRYEAGSRWHHDKEGASLSIRAAKGNAPPRPFLSIAGEPRNYAPPSRSSFSLRVSQPLLFSIGKSFAQLNSFLLFNSSYMRIKRIALCLFISLCLFCIQIARLAPYTHQLLQSQKAIILVVRLGRRSALDGVLRLVEVEHLVCTGGVLRRLVLPHADEPREAKADATARLYPA